MVLSGGPTIRPSSPIGWQAMQLAPVVLRKTAAPRVASPVSFASSDGEGRVRPSLERWMDTAAEAAAPAGVIDAAGACAVPGVGLFMRQAINSLIFGSLFFPSRFH